MTMEGPWRTPDVEGQENDYKYNGKEEKEDFGLKWLCFKARWYDAAIGRFTGVDPIADQFPHLSAFNYAGNGPISNIDLHGLQAVLNVTLIQENQTTTYTTKVTENTTYANRGKYGKRGTLNVTHNMSTGEITENFEISTIDRIRNFADAANEFFKSSESASEVDGGLAGSAENGQGAETRTNPNAENVELDEFTSGATPKHPAGQVGAISRVTTKVGEKVVNNHETTSSDDSPAAEIPVDSVCNSCTNKPHGMPYRRLNNDGVPIDTIDPHKQ